MFHDHRTPGTSEPRADRPAAADPSFAPPEGGPPLSPPALDGRATPEEVPAPLGAAGRLDPQVLGDEATPAATETSGQPPASVLSDRPAGWPERRAALLPPPADLPPAPGGSTAGGGIPLEDRIVLVATYCYKTWFAGNPVRARGLMEGVPEFQKAYASPNALGTLLGKGVAGHGLGLFRRGDAYPPTYANGWQLAHRLTSGQFEQVARRLQLDGPEALAAAVRQLPETYP